MSRESSSASYSEGVCNESGIGPVVSPSDSNCDTRVLTYSQALGCVWCVCVSVPRNSHTHTLHATEGWGCGCPFSALSSEPDTEYYRLCPMRMWPRKSQQDKMAFLSTDPPLVGFRTITRAQNESHLFPESSGLTHGLVPTSPLSGLLHSPTSSGDQGNKKLIFTKMR